MAKGRIGLDIGSTAVRAAELDGGDPPTVVKAAQVPLPGGAVENGEVKDPTLVTQALRELWERGGFKARRVFMGVGNQRVVVREIALPYLPDKELRASLGFQVQEFIPMAVDEAVLDYDPIGEFEQDDRRMLRMLLVAAQRQMVDISISAATAAKLEPVGLDLVPFALVRAVGTTGVGMDLEEEGDEAIIDIGAHVTNIVVHARGTVRFVRILPSGGRDVTLAIMRGIGVADEVAERLKRGEAVNLDALADPQASPSTDGDGQREPPAGVRARSHGWRVRRRCRRGGEASRREPGPRDHDGARRELRRRGAVLARVLHRAGAGGTHLPGAGHRRRIQARRVPRPVAPAHPRRGAGGSGLPERAPAALAR